MDPMPDPNKDLDITIPKELYQQALNSIPPYLKPWLPVIIAGILAVGASFGITIKSVTSDPHVSPPVNVVVHPPTPDKPDVNPKPAPMSARYVLYVTEKVDVAKLATDPQFKTLNIAVEPTIYKDGYGFGAVALPCLVKIGVDGKVVAVEPWTTVAAAETWIKKS